MGKSGSFFFFSHDNRLLIKTMNNDDFEAFQRIMRHYFTHIKDNSDLQGSLLARIYGVFSITMADQAPVNLILMGSSRMCPDYTIANVFDLKGSITKRFNDWSTVKNTSAIKDENLLKLKNLRHFLNFRKNDRE